MASVLKTLLDNLSSKITANNSDITQINVRLNDVGSGITLEEYISDNNSNISKIQSDLQTAGSDITALESDVTQLSSGIASVRNEVTTARGGQASLDARLDDMTSSIDTNTTDVEEALTRITAAESDITELGTELNQTNSDVTSVTAEVTTARGSSANLNARISSVESKANSAASDAEDAMSTASTAQSTANEASQNASSAVNEISTATGSFATLSSRIAGNGFTGFGRVLNTTAKQWWISLSSGVNYYDVRGNETDQTSAIYTIEKLGTIPTLVRISIANILTVTSIDLLPTAITSINIEGVLYTVYAIQLPNTDLISNACVQNSYVDSPVVFAPNASAITTSLLGNLGNMGSTMSSNDYHAYLPVLRPATSPGTVFKFLSTKIDPDTNTVQYSTFNSQIVIPL